MKPYTYILYAPRTQDLKWPFPFDKRRRAAVEGTAREH